MKNIIRQVWAISILAAIGLIGTASAEPELEAGAATIIVAKSLSETWKMETSHAQTLDGTGVTFSTAGFAQKTGSFVYRYQLINVRPEPTEQRPDPRDRRLRLSVHHSSAISEISLKKYLRVEYRFRDRVVGDDWRIRPGVGLGTKFTILDHQFFPQVNFETFYNLEEDKIDSHLFSAVLGYRVTDSVTVIPGYLRLIVPGNDDTEYFTTVLSLSFN